MYKQLSSKAEERATFDDMAKQLRSTEKQMEEGRVILRFFESHLANVACQDLAADTVLPRFMLPILQVRLLSCFLWHMLWGSAPAAVYVANIRKLRMLPTSTTFKNIVLSRRTS